LAKPLIPSKGLKNLTELVSQFDALALKLNESGHHLAFKLASLTLTLQQVLRMLETEYKELQELRGDVLRSIYKAGKYGSGPESRD
jgi:hypothetical protein